MREIIFDTETTGLNPAEDRVIELGAVELVNRFPTGRSFHHYINPEGRPVHPDAFAIHGISDRDLIGKPAFVEIVEEFLAFVGDGLLVAHNAGFDMSFLDAEFRRLGRPVFDPARIIDTLAIARRRHPMGPNSLDALCRRYGIGNAHRTKHGALLDAELLAEVYIEMVGGKQAALGLEIETVATGFVTGVSHTLSDAATALRPRPLQPRLTAEEEAAHAAMVEELGANALWRRVAE